MYRALAIGAVVVLLGVVGCDLEPNDTVAQASANAQLKFDRFLSPSPGTKSYFGTMANDRVDVDRWFYRTVQPGNSIVYWFKPLSCLSVRVQKCTVRRERWGSCPFENRITVVENQTVCPTGARREFGPFTIGADKLIQVRVQESAQEVFTGPNLYEMGLYDTDAPPLL